MPPPPSTSGLVLLCLDVQPNFLKAIARADVLQRRCAFALQAAAGLGLDLLFTEQVPQKLGGTAPELLALVASPAIFAKTTFSALANAAVRDALQSRHAEHLLLCGIETPVCVYQTAIDALHAGRQVTLLADCIGARRDDDARLALDALARAGAHVLPSETVFYSLLRDATHPFFKTYTQLVKNHA
ncbi:MAG TPA: isochorismatase family protein [Opitutus sp.]|nr:isochorismatase family protein [Opitutus sp.]